MAAVHTGCISLTQSTIRARGDRLSAQLWDRRRPSSINFSSNGSTTWLLPVLALERKSGGAAAVPNSNYVVPLDSNSSSCITRPLAEILRDLNKRIPDNIIIRSETEADDPTTFIPWYHANRMLSFYAPGWCGEIRDVIFSDNGSVTVVYRVTVRGSDGEEKEPEHIKKKKKM